MSELKLKNCPFCDCEMNVRSNRDWHQPEGDHEDHCPIYDTDLMYPATDIGLSALVNCWNTRVTQPEATKPAQELGAAILALPLPDPSSLADFHISAMLDVCIGDPVYSEFKMRDLLKAAAALASPADALVAGDREKLAEVREAVLKYFDDLSARRNGGVAQYHLINRIEEVLGMSWRSGVNHRAAIQAQKDGHD